MIETITRIPVAHFANVKPRAGYSIKVDTTEVALLKQPMEWFMH